MNPEVLGWDELRERFAKGHRPGEHIAAVGPTGGGKSTVVLELAKIIGARRTRANRPASVTVLAVKRRDRTIEKLHREGWPYVKEWPPSYGQEHCIVWPHRTAPRSVRAKRQSVVIGGLLDRIDDEGGQTIVIDEEAYFERPLPRGLGLGATMEGAFSESRSNDVTVIAATQRPRHVTLLMWSEPSWLVIMKPESLDDLKHVAGLSGEKEAVLEIVPQLGGFEFLCVRRQRDGTRALYVSKVGAKPPGGKRAKDGERGRGDRARGIRRDRDRADIPTTTREEQAR